MISEAFLANLMFLNEPPLLFCGDYTASVKSRGLWVSQKAGLCISALDTELYVLCHMYGLYVLHCIGQITLAEGIIIFYINSPLKVSFNPVRAKEIITITSMRGIVFVQISKIAKWDLARAFG